MPFPRKLLNQGEEIVLDLRPHWIALTYPTLGVVFGLVLSGLALWSGEPAFEVIALVGAPHVASSTSAPTCSGGAAPMFVVTTDRIISRRGVLTKSGIEIPLERVNTVFFNQRLVERLVGAGDLALESASERGTQTFNNVRKPDLVQREIYVQMEANENRKFDRAGAANRAAAGSGLSTAEQVEKLHDLLNKGAITPAQFEAEKARLLGG